jgi:uncharacterized protein YjbJ (UPF0337 family)
MSTEALISLNNTTLTAEFTPQASKLKEEALTVSAAIGKVTDQAENANAVEAQKALAEVIKLVEQARKAAKDPVLAFGKKIDEQAKGFVEELAAEQWRVSRLVGDFQQLEAKKAQAARQAERDRLTALEKERLAAIAQAKTHEELDRIEEAHNNAVQQQAPTPLVAAHAQGQRVGEEIKFEVFDINALYASKPGCVKMEPKMLEIRALLKAGLALPGVRHWTETKATVSLRGQKVIEV